MITYIKKKIYDLFDACNGTDLLLIDIVKFITRRYYVTHSHIERTYYLACSASFLDSAHVCVSEVETKECNEFIVLKRNGCILFALTTQLLWRKRANHVRSSIRNFSQYPANLLSNTSVLMHSEYSNITCDVMVFC